MHSARQGISDHHLRQVADELVERGKGEGLHPAVREHLRGQPLGGLIVPVAQSLGCRHRLVRRWGSGRGSDVNLGGRNLCRRRGAGHQCCQAAPAIFESLRVLRFSGISACVGEKPQRGVRGFRRCSNCGEAAERRPRRLLTLIQRSAGKSVIAFGPTSVDALPSNYPRRRGYILQFIVRTINNASGIRQSQG